MANRVVLGALPGGGYGLRISRPGFNALSTGLTGKQLAFDSDWPSSVREVAHGTVTTQAGTHAVSFGTTLSGVPNLITLGQTGSDWFTRGGPFEFASLQTFQITTTGAGSIMTGGQGPVNDWLDLSKNVSAAVQVFTNRFEYTTVTSGALIAYLVLFNG